MPEQPSGIVTFLFTDIEGSTRLWDRLPDAMGVALARHDALLREAVAANGGHVFKTVGDAVCAAFPLTTQALAAAVAAQRALGAETWGEVGRLRVRMALHAGAAEERDDDYFGPPLNRVARLLAAGHGGQVLLSRVAHDLVRDRLPADLALRDLGEHRLKDLHHPERVFQVEAADLPADFPPLRTPERFLRGLPVHPTSLIGREQEVAAVRALLLPPAGEEATRLLTLTGPGGAGKTRLALHLAADLGAAFADGACFVSLATVVDPELVLPEIAAGLGLRETGGGSLRELVRDELRDRHLLLVLDNLEQVMAAAAVIADLLTDCPRLTVVATSRERLRLRGEQELPLPPLALPEPAIGGVVQPLPLAELIGYEAVRLFVERARAVKPGFELTHDNAAAVVEICRRLDGLPLAIELAAARVRLLPPKAMLGRLDRRLDLLAGGARDLPGRQQTMRGAIAWSFDLLSEDEQRLFARLAVFAGGCTLEAAERVAGEPGAVPDTFDLLTSLADKSLIRLADDAADEPRLEMLETIREYGLEQLKDSGEDRTIGGRHAEFFLAQAEEAEPHLEGPEQARWLDRLDRDHANLRAALGWLRDEGAAAPAVRLASALWRFWWLRGHTAEGRGQLEALRHASGVSPALRAKALNGAGVLAESQSNYAVAAAYHEESLAISRSLGDKHGIAWSLNNLGIVALSQGDYDRARQLLEENLAIAQEVGDAASEATAYMDLGQVARFQGDQERATALITRGLGLFRNLGDKSHIARALNNLGGLALDQGDYHQAGPLLEESLALLREVRDLHAVASTLNNLAEVARGLGDDERATALYEECRALAEETGNRLCAAVALESLADLARRHGDDERAEDGYRAALTLYRAVDDWLGITACLAGLATVAADRGRAETAVSLFGAVAALREAHGLPQPDHDADGQVLAAARANLGEERFAAAWRAGQEQPLNRLIGQASLAMV